MEHLQCGCERLFLRKEVKDEKKKFDPPLAFNPLLTTRFSNS